MAKEIKYGAEARAALEAGVNPVSYTHLHTISRLRCQFLRLWVYFRRKVFAE